jgi:tRNA nucleotidyltransferase (CCA-adding enzyme)
VTAILSFLKDLFPPSCHNRVYLVGGTVRDILLGRESQDIDLVAALSETELTALGFHAVEPTSGATIYFRFHPEFGKIEITRIAAIDDLEKDLFRRDFTVNAMAMDLSGKHVDPLSGRDDLKGKVLRACTLHTFTIDPLRILRAFRFEADGWRMATESEQLIRSQDWSEAFSTMPIERFSGEMLKALEKKTPERFFEQMIDSNIGAEFLPEVFRMPCIPAGPPQHHPEGDLLSHSIQVLQRVAAVSGDPLARFCAFFHDLGKLATDPAFYPKHHGHDNAGFSMAVDFCNRLHLPATYRKALAWISSLHGKANKWGELRNSSKIKIAEQAIKAGIVGILPLVAAADKAGGLPMTGWETVIRVAGMSTRELEIDPEKLELMPVKSRPSFIMQHRIERLKRIS